MRVGVCVCDAPRIRSRQRKHHRVHNISSDVYWWSKPAPPSSEKLPGEKMQHHTHGGGERSRALTLHDVLSSGNSSSRGAVNWWTCDRVICHFYWQWLRIIWDEEWTLSLETNSPQFTQFKFNFLLPHQTAHARMALYPYVTKWRVMQLFASWFLEGN